jgi:hypothetical protein
MSIKSKLLKRARYRAKKKGQLFDLTEDDITVSSFCPILGIPLHVNDGMIGGRFNSPTLDRKDNARGYVPGNVWVISQLANQMKSNANTGELKDFANWIKQNYE